MIVRDLTLKNFRNYNSEKIEFSPFVNIIYGNNAQGKTNILEGIYLFSMGKSNRTYHDEQLIRFGADEAELYMNFFGGGREISAQMTINKSRRKRVLINEIPVRKNSDLVGRFNVVYFGPDSMDIVKGGPSHRRRNFDILISSLRSNYFVCLSKYKKIIESKSAVLKADKVDEMTLGILNEQLIDLSAEIIKYRAEYIKKIEKIAGEIQREISNGAENLEIKYISAAGASEEFDEDEVKKSLAEKIEKNYRREIEFREVMVGPRRDSIEYFINGVNAKNFSSQGQQKTVAMVQKIAEVNLIFEEKGEYPVLLLDDIMSELDFIRQSYILTRIKNMQIIITCTDKERFNTLPDTNTIKVEKGRIV